MKESLWTEILYAILNSFIFQLAFFPTIMFVSCGLYKDSALKKGERPTKPTRWLVGIDLFFQAVAVLWGIFLKQLSLFPTLPEKELHKNFVVFVVTLFMFFVVVLPTIIHIQQEFKNKAKRRNYSNSLGVASLAFALSLWRLL